MVPLASILEDTWKQNGKEIVLYIDCFTVSHIKQNNKKDGILWVIIYPCPLLVQIHFQGTDLKIYS